MNKIFKISLKTYHRQKELHVIAVVKKVNYLKKLFIQKIDVEKICCEGKIISSRRLTCCNGKIRDINTCEENLYRENHIFNSDKEPRFLYDDSKGASISFIFLFMNKIILKTR